MKGPLGVSKNVKLCMSELEIPQLMCRKVTQEFVMLRGHKSMGLWLTFRPKKANIHSSSTILQLHLGCIVIDVFRIRSSETSAFTKCITTSWELWKHSNPVPGVRPVFLKPKFHKKSKNRSKAISVRRSWMSIFSNYFFLVPKKIEKNWRVSLLINSPIICMP